MSDNVLETQVAELKAELVQAKSDAEALKAEVVSQKDEELQSKIEAFEATVAEKEEVVASKDAELATASESIEAHQAEKKLLARKTALLEAGVEGEGAEAAIERFAEASDEMFKEIVQILAAMYKKKADEKSSKEDDKKDDSKKDDNKDEDKDKKLPPWLKKKGASADEATEADEAEEVDEAEAEASDEVLETAEEEVEAALTDAGEDSSLEAKTAASDWLESNVLRSTARIQE